MFVTSTVPESASCQSDSSIVLSGMHVNDTQGSHTSSAISAHDESVRQYALAYTLTLQLTQSNAGGATVCKRDTLPQDVMHTSFSLSPLLCLFCQNANVWQASVLLIVIQPIPAHTCLSCRSQLLPCAVPITWPKVLTKSTSFIER
jgi:hypothetical protein